MSLVNAQGQPTETTAHQEKRRQGMNTTVGEVEEMLHGFAQAIWARFGPVAVLQHELMDRMAALEDHYSDHVVPYAYTPKGSPLVAGAQAEPTTPAPATEVIRLINIVYGYHEVGGCLHAVLDDENVEDPFLSLNERYCDSDVQHEAEEACVRALRGLSEDDRRRAIREAAVLRGAQE